MEWRLSFVGMRFKQNIISQSTTKSEYGTLEAKIKYDWMNKIHWKTMLSPTIQGWHRNILWLQEYT